MLVLTDSPEQGPSEIRCVILAFVFFQPAARWLLLHRVVFRFIFVYLILYTFPYLSILWRPFVVWIGARLFHLNITIFPAGSGDTTYNYIELFCIFATSVILTTAWSLTDRRRLHYKKLHNGLRIWIRYNLGLILMGYGMAKIIQLQFPSPGPWMLTQSYGDSSPMGLLWTFMGYSRGYNIFTGLAETIPALLLFYRRTTTLGALLATIAMTNVVALNFFFDVPVKLFSLHLLLMSIFLLVPDLKALSHLLIFQREVLPPPVRPAFRPAFPWPRFNLAWQILKTVLLSVSLGAGTYASLGTYRSYTDHSAWPLYGAYQVQSFFQDGKSEPLSGAPWRELVMMHGLLRARHPEGTSTYAYTSGDQKLVLRERKQGC